MIRKMSRSLVRPWKGDGNVKCRVDRCLKLKEESVGFQKVHRRKAARAGTSRSNVQAVLISAPAFVVATVLLAPVPATVVSTALFPVPFTVVPAAIVVGAAVEVAASNSVAKKPTRRMVSAIVNFMLSF